MSILLILVVPFIPYLVRRGGRKSVSDTNMIVLRAQAKEGVGTLIPIMGILYLVPLVFSQPLETLWRVMRTDLDLILI